LLLLTENTNIGKDEITYSVIWLVFVVVP